MCGDNKSIAGNFLVQDPNAFTLRFLAIRNEVGHLNTCNLIRHI